MNEENEFQQDSVDNDLPQDLDQQDFQEKLDDKPVDYALNRGKYRKFFLIACVINFFTPMLGQSLLFPVLACLIMANYYYHKANPNLNFTQKVVTEFLGLTVVSLITFPLSMLLAMA